MIRTLNNKYDKLTDEQLEKIMGGFAFWATHCCGAKAKSGMPCK